MAIEAGVPVLPVVTWGGQRVWTAGRRPKWRRGVPVILHVGEPIPVTAETTATGSPRQSGGPGRAHRAGAAVLPPRQRPARRTGGSRRISVGRHRRRSVPGAGRGRGDRERPAVNRRRRPARVEPGHDDDSHRLARRSGRRSSCLTARWVQSPWACRAERRRASPRATRRAWPPSGCVRSRHSLHRAGRSRGLAVWTVEYRYRGWNGDERSPVVDTQWALEEVRRRHGDVPVVLVGHSMGGRTALQAAGDPSVRGVCALAPWTEARDPVEQLAGRSLLIAHGSWDTVTSAAASRRYAERASAVTSPVGRFVVEADLHAMVFRWRRWHVIATGFALGTLQLRRCPVGSSEPFARAPPATSGSGSEPYRCGLTG